jgi:membrane associated rhomboid family serine protease
MLLIPIGHDRQVTKRLPVITLTLIAFNILVFIFTETVGTQQQARLTSSLKALIEFTDKNAQQPLAEQVKTRLARIPSLEIEYIRNTIFLEKIDPERTPEKGVLVSPRGIEDPVILTMESQRVGNSFVAAYDEFYAYQYGFIPAYHKFSWLNYITCTFLHAGFLHILGNMLFLFFAGLAVEDASTYSPVSLRLQHLLIPHQIAGFI